MPVHVIVEQFIARPPAMVARVMFDPARDAEWTSGVIESRPHAPGHLRPGARVDRRVRFLGRTFWYTYEVTAADAQSWVEMRVTDPFPMTVRYELSAAGGGTVARIGTEGDAGGFFRYVGPLLSPMVRRNITKDLRALKRVVEASEPHPML